MSNPDKEEAVTLLPCPVPWCGDDNPEVVPVGMGRCEAVQCTKCRATGPWSQNEAEAIAAWNARQADPRIAELKAALRHVRPLLVLRSGIPREERGQAIERIDAALIPQEEEVERSLLARFVGTVKGDDLLMMDPDLSALVEEYNNRLSPPSDGVSRDE